nr:redoxin domain-containing protein [Armatimonas sp.]
MWKLGQATLPPLDKPAPLFTLVDVGGKKRPLVSFKGHPLTLCFFCGCNACADVALQWAQLQRGKALPKEAITLLIYQGSAEEVQALARRSALDPALTILLPDTDRKVTDALYHADPCPRLLVIDPKGILRYANTGPDDKPQEAPAAIIVAKALDVLNRCVPPPKSKR